MKKFVLSTKPSLFVIAAVMAMPLVAHAGKEPNPTYVEYAKVQLMGNALSRDQLIFNVRSLTGNTISVEEATVAVDSLKVDYDKQAVIKAKRLAPVNSEDFTCQSLTAYMTKKEKFTPAQAALGARAAPVCK